jgi:hypothetical protein
MKEKVFFLMISLWSNSCFFILGFCHEEIELLEKLGTRIRDDDDGLADKSRSIIDEGIEDLPILSLEDTIPSLESLYIGQVYFCSIFFIFRIHIVIYHGIDSFKLESSILRFHRYLCSFYRLCRC